MKSIPFALASLLLASSLPVLAQSAPAVPTPPWTVTGNAGLVSDYRFRGISQTDRDPALQGGIDIVHSSGFYVGNWNSNVDSSFYNGANLEMDFYGGYKTTFRGFGVDLGAIHYYYPGSGKGATVRIKNTEVYLGATYGPVGLKYFVSTSDFFSIPNSKRSGYLDLGLTHDLGSGFGVNAHVGYQKIRNVAGDPGRITDYKLGATYDYKGYVFGAAYVDTNRSVFNTASPSGKDLGKGALLLSVTKTF